MKEQESTSQVGRAMHAVLLSQNDKEAMELPFQHPVFDSGEREEFSHGKFHYD